MKIDSLTLHHISMPLVAPFETSFGRETDRQGILITLQADGLTAYGECVATRDPGYNYETAGTAWHILKDFIAPLILGKDIKDAYDFQTRVENIRGHHLAKAGVEIKVIGGVGKRSAALEVRKLVTLRLHTRTIIRDRHQAFVGSQSLRQAELDSRREVGVFVREAKVVNGLVKTFETDWAMRPVGGNQQAEAQPRVLKKALKTLVKELSPLNPVVKEALKEAGAAQTGSASLNPQEVKETVKEAVKEAVQERVGEMVKESLQES